MRDIFKSVSQKDNGKSIIVAKSVSWLKLRLYKIPWIEDLVGLFTKFAFIDFPRIHFEFDSIQKLEHESLIASLYKNTSRVPVCIIRSGAK